MSDAPKAEHLYASIQAVAYEGHIYLEIWTKERRDEDPIRLRVTPGQALDLAGRLPLAIKDALAQTMSAFTP